jgi:ubiquinone/menaquinone biosynthesis C-methylase UbiE
MHQPVEYDAFADIYDIWVDTAPAAKRNLPFYVEEYLRSPEPVVELGVGNGRIAVEAARQDKPIIGVDSSAEMLKLCRERAEAAGVAHLLTLIQADFRDFTLPEPAQLIAIPYHTRRTGIRPSSPT